jgi:hypothetical protein
VIGELDETCAGVDVATWRAYYGALARIVLVHSEHPFDAQLRETGGDSPVFADFFDGNSSARCDASERC